MSRQRLGAAPGLVLGLVLAAARPGLAQRVLVLPEPGTTVAALAIDLDASGLPDAAEPAGTARLAAEALVEAVRPALALLGATARVDCGGSKLRVELLAPPSTWRAAAERLLDALFHPSIQPEPFDSARSRLARTLAFQQGDPATEFRTVARTALFGAGHPWAAGTCGSPETMAMPTIEATRAAAGRFTPEHATAAVVGAVRPADGATVLAAAFGQAGLAPAPPRPEPPPRPRSLEVTSPTITAWVGVVFPLPPDPDETATRLLAHRVLEDVRPSPQRPAVVDAGAWIERFGGGGALTLYVAAEADSVSGWATRVRRLVEAAAATAMDPGEFKLLLRRFRGERLLALATPEARAADAAGHLYFGQEYTAPAGRLAALTPATLQAAAAALGAPVVAYLGPDPGGAASLDGGRSPE